MDIVKVSGIAMIAALAASAVKSADAKIGAQAALAGGLILLIYAVSSLTGIVRTLDLAMSEAGVDRSVAEFVFKVTGLAFMTQLAVGVCTDAGENGIAEKVSLCGRLAIVSASLTQIAALLNTVRKLAEECL